MNFFDDFSLKESTTRPTGKVGQLANWARWPISQPGNLAGWPSGQLGSSAISSTCQVGQLGNPPNWRIGQLVRLAYWNRRRRTTMRTNRRRKDDRDHNDDPQTSSPVLGSGVCSPPKFKSGARGLGPPLALAPSPHNNIFPAGSLLLWVGPWCQYGKPCVSPMDKFIHPPWQPLVGSHSHHVRRRILSDCNGVSSGSLLEVVLLQRIL